MKAFGEFFFFETSKRRTRAEILHDILMIAKEGLGKTRIMYAANLSWEPTKELLQSAEAAGFINERPTPRIGRYRPKRTKSIWKTTDKGRKYARAVYDNFKIFEVIDA